MTQGPVRPPREIGPGQFQKSATSLLTSLAARGYSLTIGPQGAGHNKRKEAHSGHRSSRSNRTRYSWSRCVHRTMNRSPGLVTPGNSHSVDYTWPLQMGTAAEIPDPEANRQSLGKVA